MPGSDDSWDYCDRSPCKRLLNGLGRYIFGDEQGGYVMAFSVKRRKAPVSIIPIRYCPFCGTRLSELDVAVKRMVSCPER